MQEISSTDITTSECVGREVTSPRDPPLPTNPRLYGVLEGERVYGGDSRSLATRQVNRVMHRGLSSEAPPFLGQLDREIVASLNRVFSITSVLQ